MLNKVQIQIRPLADTAVHSKHLFTCILFTYLLKNFSGSADHPIIQSTVCYPRAYKYF